MSSKRFNNFGQILNEHWQFITESDCTISNNRFDLQSYIRTTF